MKYTLLACTALMAVTAASAKVQLASTITDNMVLQQNTNARIYGKAKPGKKVTVTPSWNNKTYSGTVDKDGKWVIEVETPAGGYKPYSVTVSDGEPVTLNNVLIGEVWLASGQSNMQMPLRGYWGCPIQGGYEEVAHSGNWKDKIRFITLPLVQSYTPMDTVAASWTVPSPETSPDYSALAWFAAKRMTDVLEVPIGIVSAAYGGARVESWTPREILETYPDVSLDPKDIEPMEHYMRPLLAYNAMFMPIKDYTYKGIMWYQGCSNVGHDDVYAERLANMVRDWREKIGLGDIPFYQVELAPYAFDHSMKTAQGPLLRQAQWKACDLIPNSGIICTNDAAVAKERFNVHPSNKKVVGDRMADLVLNKTYGKHMFPCVSPKYKSHEVKGNEVWVYIDLANDVISPNCDIVGFEVAGADKVFHPADNVRQDGQNNTLIVSSSKVPVPVAVRYCWKDFQPGNVVGDNYLPLVPFRTDNWNF